VKLRPVSGKDLPGTIPAPAARMPVGEDRPPNPRLIFSEISPKRRISSENRRLDGKRSNKNSYREDFFAFCP